MEKKSPFRFAHPFFTSLPPATRPFIPGVGRRMTDHIKKNLEPIPDPIRTGPLTLEEIIGKDETRKIEQHGSICLHAVGDTGHENGQAQEAVADAMSADFDIDAPEKSPAFFLHLGDVIYYDNTDRGYHAQFYVPYKTYPGKIIAVPGNHDGELFKFDGTSTGQKTTLEAFQENFCQKKPGVPSGAGTIFREMVSQPGVYWLLDAPFVQVIGLYSNVAENPGYIQSDKIGTKQMTWLVKTLKAVKKERDKGKRRALLIAVHHPPLSNGSHSSSTEMLADIDSACTQAQVMPDAVLAAHAHNYQRFTRTVALGGKTLEIPFLVVGSGGRGLQPINNHSTAPSGDHRMVTFNSCFGYSRLTIDPQRLRIEFFKVDGANKTSFDQVEVDLTTNKII